MNRLSSKSMHTLSKPVIAMHFEYIYWTLHCQIVCSIKTYVLISNSIFVFIIDIL